MKQRNVFALASAAILTCTAGYVVGHKFRKKTAAFHSTPIDSVKPEDVGFEDYGYLKHFDIDKERSISVLITGAGSYIGESFRKYVTDHYPNIQVTTIDMKDGRWRENSFKDASGKPYDCVFHVAGIAHADVGRTNLEEQERYYAVNTDLTIETAKKAKAAGVSQFIYMSSMIIYGTIEYITTDTLPDPQNFYGNSKWLADKGVRQLKTEEFKVAVLRPPMIYGKGSKGNYSQLRRIAKSTLVFPDVRNKRSMLYLENLCEFVCLLALSGVGGVYFPQNEEYSETSELVRRIAEEADHNVVMSRLLNPAISIAKKIPGIIGGLTKKAFGDSWYDQKLSVYEGLEYCGVDLDESIRRTERNRPEYSQNTNYKKHILLISQYFHPETFRVNDIACEWSKRGYKVTVLTGIPNYPMGKYFPGYDKKHRTHEIWNGVDIIRIPLVARGNSSNKLLNDAGMAANYFSFVISGRKWVRSKEAENLNADLVFTVEVSPMTQALIGVWYSKLYHVPSYLYVQDPWPENVETVTGIHSRVVIAPIDRMVDKIYKVTGTIFTTSPSFVKAIVNRRVPVDKNKVHYWPQYAEEFYKVLPPQPVDGIDNDNGCYKIAFTGNIGTAQGLDVLPKAAKLLESENVQFIIVGDGRYQPEFERQIDSLSVRHMFIMIPRVEPDRIPGILSNVDAGFISFSNTDLWTRTIPAKLQSYMACGKAIIASASGETERVVNEAGCGVCCKIGDAEALAEGIRELMKMDSKELGSRAREYFEMHFRKDVLMDEMEEYLKRN